MLASGPEDVRERVDPLFDAVGAKTLWLGEAGAGSRLKLVLNTWLLALTEGLAEAIALAEALDVDPRTFLETIDGGPVGAPYAKLKGKLMIERDFPPSFPLELALKDAGLALAAAEAARAAARRAGGDRASRWSARSRRATARTTWLRRSRPVVPDALIIVDFQNDFARPDGALVGARRRGDRRPHQRARALRRLRAGARHARLAPAGPRLVHRAGRDLAGALRPGHAGRGAAPRARHRAARRDRRQGPGPGTEGYSAFDATALAETLRARGVDAVTVVGLATDYCVKNTALDALREGFAVRVDRARHPRRRRAARRLRARPRGAARRRVRPWRRSPPSDDPREQLLAQLRPHVSDARVLEAIRAVPRDRFVPARRAAEAWDNVALPIGSGQTISQPLVVARMCELLELRARSACSTSAPAPATTPRCWRGSCATSGRVERHPGLSERAAASLAAAGVENVTLLVGDGALGHPACAPYDAINVAAAMGAAAGGAGRPARAGRAARRPGRRRRPAADPPAPHRRRGARALRPRARAVRAADRPPLGSYAAWLGA